MNNNTQNNQSIFVVTGMHRSGTSLTASLLQNAGVNIAQKMLTSLPDNLKGNFEDLQFLKFHQKVLVSQGISHAGWTLQKKIQVQKEFVSEAQVLIDERSSQTLWGWKDPRTTLFLDFWVDLIPRANFIFIYRSPWEVVDSLYRRRNNVDIETFDKNPSLAIEIWLNYNNRILNFYERFPNQCLLLNLDSITLDSHNLLKAVKEKFGVILSYQNLDTYDNSLLTQHSDTQRASLIKHFFPEALNLYNKLNLKAYQISGSNKNITTADITQCYRDFALKDWLEVRRLEKEVEQLRSVKTESKINMLRRLKKRLFFLD